MSATPDWDYSDLAEFYELRAPYATAALSELAREAAVPRNVHAVDIGAGTGRLTRWLGAEGHSVDAIEPCAPMRRIGQSLSASMPVRWHANEGTKTGLATGSAQLVSYGSSFNVLGAKAAIDEALRLMGGVGHVLLVWNHRDLSDDLQIAVEALIQRHIPSYSRGARREDPSPIWAEHAELRSVHRCEASLQVRQPLVDFVNGFRAHGTLIRQLGSELDALLDEIYRMLAPSCAQGQIEVPFHTRAWCLKVASRCG